MEARVFKPEFAQGADRLWQNALYGTSGVAAKTAPDYGVLP